MTWVFLSLGIIGIGIYFEQIWLTIFGVVLLVLSMARVNKTIVKTNTDISQKHKLIQAPQDAWESNDAAAAMLALQGIQMPLGMDIMEPLNKDLADKVGELQMGEIRRVLPFPNYGESSAIQQLLSGIIIPLDNWFHPNTYKAKLKGKWDAKKDSFITGKEKDAEKLLED